jgi:hypothetical protein
VRGVERSTDGRRGIERRDAVQEEHRVAGAVTQDLELDAVGREPIERRHQ